MRCHDLKHLKTAFELSKPLITHVHSCSSPQQYLTRPELRVTQIQLHAMRPNAKVANAEVCVCVVRVLIGCICAIMDDISWWLLVISVSVWAELLLVCLWLCTFGGVFVFVSMLYACATTSASHRYRHTSTDMQNDMTNTHSHKHTQAMFSMSGLANVCGSSALITQNDGQVSTMFLGSPQAPVRLRVIGSSSTAAVLNFT